MSKQIHRNCYKSMIDDLFALRDGGKSSNGVMKKSKHPEVGGELFDKFIEHLKTLSEKTENKSKGISMTKINEKVLGLTDEEKQELIKMIQESIAAA